MREQIKDRRRYRTMLDSRDKFELNSLLRDELAKNGIDINEIPLLSPAAMMIAGFNTLFDDVNMALQYTARESNLIHAEFPSSLINQLAQHTSEVVISRPSKIELFVRIPADDIKRYGNHVQSDTWELPYSDSNSIIIDELPFMPVIPMHYIRATYIKDKMIPRVFYMNPENPNQKVNVLVQKVRVEGVEILGFKATFKQIQIEEQEFTFDDSQLSKFLLKTENPISDFELFYRSSSGSNDEIKINKRLYYTRGTGNFIEYQIHGNNTVALVHKYIQGGFRPSVGGVLRAKCYCTTGRNIKYRGPVITNETTRYTRNVSYEGVGVKLLESIGGNVASTDQEYLRNFVIKLRGARKRIDTETDLQTFLLNYEGNSKFLPKLVHNDIKHRIFNIYSIISFESKRNGVSRVFTVPTNTGTIQVNLKDLHTKDLNGFRYYSINSDDLIRSEQSRKSDVFTIEKTLKPGKEPEIPEKTDPLNPDNNLYTFFYVTPFIISYDRMNNFAKVYMGGQYDETYLSFQTYEDIRAEVPVRFVNTSIRVHDYNIKARGNKINSIYQIRAEIRAESDSWKLEHLKTCRPFITIEDDKQVKHKIPVTYIESKEDNKHELIFFLKTDKRVYGSWCEFDYIDIDGGHHTANFNVTSKIALSFEIKENEDTPIDQFQRVSEYTATVDLFKNVTKNIYLQTNEIADNVIQFLSTPMVKSRFYMEPNNQRKIVSEVKRIIQFIDHAVYNELDEYSSRSDDLHDRLESMMSVSIKFAKTYGLSKFLEVGNVRKTFIYNLQLNPSVFIRKLDEDYDESAIASELNHTLITHDYLMEDLHMSSLIWSVLDKTGDAVSMIQFKNFSNYPSDYHMISRNNITPNNLDPPEVVSLEPVYDEEIDNYRFNMEFIKI